ncbi:MAG TPA: TonB family protein [Vicinamibacteria bacterium]|nr:TonB family protein [Vicinamibacteria bacterium]
MKSASLLVMATLLGLASAMYEQGAREPYPVGGDIRKPERTHFVSPEYPAEAQAQNVQALVIVELTLKPDGTVGDVRALRGPEPLLPAAMAAARQWRYAPTIVNGEAVPIRFAETVLFLLRPPAEPPPPGRLGGNGMYLRPPSPGTTSASYADWEVEGEAFTCCPCDTPCPCRSNAAPSHPPCHATTAQHFFRGHYGSVDLTGVTYVTLGPETWTAIYFSEEMSESQQRAILDIYASMAPGAPQVYRSVRTGPIHYEANPDRTSKRVVIPGVLEMESSLRTGADRLTALGMDIWSNRIAYGTTGVYRYADPQLGEAWDHSGRQSNHKTFRTTKAMFDRRQMLIQLGDGSGRWTPAQERLIACLK